MLRRGPELAIKKKRTGNIRKGAAIASSLGAGLVTWHLDNARRTNKLRYELSTLKTRLEKAREMEHKETLVMANNVAYDLLRANPGLSGRIKEIVLDSNKKNDSLKAIRRKITSEVMRVDPEITKEFSENSIAKLVPEKGNALPLALNDALILVNLSDALVAQAHEGLQRPLSMRLTEEISQKETELGDQADRAIVDGGAVTLSMLLLFVVTTKLKHFKIKKKPKVEKSRLDNGRKHGEPEASERPTLPPEYQSSFMTALTKALGDHIPVSHLQKLGRISGWDCEKGIELARLSQRGVTPEVASFLLSNGVSGRQLDAHVAIDSELEAHGLTHDDLLHATGSLNEKTLAKFYSKIERYTNWLRLMPGEWSEEKKQELSAFLSLSCDAPQERAGLSDLLKKHNEAFIYAALKNANDPDHISDLIFDYGEYAERF